MNEIVKVCKKHGSLIDSQCYLFKRDKRYVCKQCNNRKTIFCYICNNSFFGNREAKYCSEKCRKKSWEIKRETNNLKKKKIECKNCKKIFYYNKFIRKIFCSFECSMSFKSVKNRICQYCNNEFKPSIRSHKNIQKYCSIECNNKNKADEKKHLIDNGIYICVTHGILPIDSFMITKTKNIKYTDGFRYSCKICNKIQSDKYREKNKNILLEKKRVQYSTDPLMRQKMKELQKRWRKENPDLVKASRKRYRIKNKNKINEKRKIQISELKPYYVKACLLTKLPMKEVPKELIEIKSLYMKIRRKLKELKYGNK